MDLHNSQDIGMGQDGIGIASQVSLSEKGKWKGNFFLDKWEFPEEIREEAETMLQKGAKFEDIKAKFGDKYYLGKVDIGENLLLNEGINALLTLAAGGVATAFSNANAYLGVGDSATAEAAAQTGLQAASNKTYKAMDSSFPTYGSSQLITFRATFLTGDANYAWNEFTVANGSSDAAVNLNRKVSAQGTKIAGQTWQLSLVITIS